MNNETQSNLPLDHKRMWIIYILIGAVFLVYTGRLFNLQVVKGAEYLARAEENRTNVINIPTQRGIIYDRNGVILARNVPSYNVTVTPANLPGNPVLVVDSYREYYGFEESPEAGAVQEVYRKLSELTGIPLSNPDAYDEDGYLTEEVTQFFKACDNDLGITEIVLIGDTRAPYSPIQIACDVGEEVAMIIRERSVELPGVDIEVSSVREYPTGVSTSEIIGFLGPIPAIEEEYYTDLGFVANRDKVGYAGVESTLQDILGGRNGTRTVEVDVAGKILRDLEPPVEPIPGDNVRLTIDIRLQMAAREALISEIDGWNSWIGYEKYPSGVVIAINPKTGEILSLVSYPTYENNRMARMIPAYYWEQLQKDPKAPLFNHAISAEYPPGSVYKMATAIGILNEDVVTPEQTIEDPGKITLEQSFAPNDPLPLTQDYVCYLYKSTNAGHGPVDFLRGVAESCDVYFYKVGGGYQDEVPEGLGIWRMNEYARALGYGVKTGIELPGEEDGLLPDPTWKRINQGENWATGDTYIATIGQGYVLSTPLQVLNSIATLANDGKHMKTTLVREIIDSEGDVVQSFEPQQLWDITVDPLIHEYDENFLQTDVVKTVEPWVIEYAQEGMRQVVTIGTASSIFQGFEIPSAGKTGTAEYCDYVAQLKDICKPGLWPAHAWYVGYAPYDDPEIAVVAFVYNGDEGSKVAAPIVRRVMDAYFRLKAIDSQLPEQ